MEELDKLIAEKTGINKAYLLKFDDIPKLFEDASDLIEKYFENQKAFKTLESFKENLTKLLKLYSSSFSMTTEEYDRYFDYLNLIENKYHELLYFGEDHNPVEYIKNLNKNNVVNILSKKK